MNKPVPVQRDALRFLTISPQAARLRGSGQIRKWVMVVSVHGWNRAACGEMVKRPRAAPLAAWLALFFVPIISYYMILYDK